MPAVAKKKKRASALSVNLAYAIQHSSGDVLMECTKKLKWTVSTSRSSGKQHLYFVMNRTDLEVVAPLIHDGPCCVSRFPGMHEVCGKYGFAKLALLYDHVFEGILSFMPCTWLLPDQANEALAVLPTSPSPKSPALIVKPDAGAQGDGIFICRSHNDLARHSAIQGVAQLYVANPLLLDGLKFDFRLYVLVTSLSPLRAYLCRSGLARFCTEPYTSLASGASNNVCAHLTNYAINKRSSNFAHASDGAEVASKRPLKLVLQQLEAAYPNRFSADRFWTEAEDIVAKTLLMMQLRLQQQYDRLWGPGTTTDKCFQLLGYDILLDSDCHLVLLEINNSPSLRLDEVHAFDSNATNHSDQPQTNASGVCRCMDMHVPHVHSLSPVDCEVKEMVVGGALLVLQQERHGGGDAQPWGPLEDLYIPIDGSSSSPNANLVQFNSLMASTIAALSRTRGGTHVLPLSGLRRLVVQQQLCPTAHFDLIASNARRLMGVNTEDLSVENFFELMFSLAQAMHRPRRSTAQDSQGDKGSYQMICDLLIALGDRS